jgi:hypothetical protein
MARSRLFGGNGDLGPTGKILIILTFLGFISIIIGIVSFVIWKLTGSSTAKDTAYYSLLISIGLIGFSFVSGYAMGVDFIESTGSYTGLL